jgi:hypothetical protein
MAVNYDKHVFVSIEGDSLIIRGQEGWDFVSIFVKASSTAEGEVSSDYVGKIGGVDNDKITVAAGSGITIGSGRASVDGITITAPVGCIIDIQGVKNSPNIGG